MKDAIFACIALGCACFVWELLVYYFFKREEGDEDGFLDEVEG